MDDEVKGTDHDDDNNANLITKMITHDKANCISARKKGRWCDKIKSYGHVNT